MGIKAWKNIPRCCSAVDPLVSRSFLGQIEAEAQARRERDAAEAKRLAAEAEQRRREEEAAARRKMEEEARLQREAEEARRAEAEAQLKVTRAAL